jgi:transposase
VSAGGARAHARAACAAAAWPAAHPPGGLGGRQGVQLPDRAALPARAGHPGGDPHALGSARQSLFDRDRYRERNIIERVVGWLKESRRLATRYEKLAVNFLAMVKLAMRQRCLRVLDSSNRA